MASDSRLKANNPEYRRGEWGILVALAIAWTGTLRDPILEGALRPFLEFTWRHNKFPVPWRHRWYILFTGRLPLDF